ncbi:thymidylate synthase, partial [Candidatus Woesearchaeota archaeon]|nr:thymidylate synthase [Candidatus Woesearchaeota archaeon]
MSKPKYNSELLTLGNPESQVGIITLFTQKDRVLSFLSPDDFYVVGQLYNPSQGISILIRNCLANKNIRYLIVCGLDLSQSGEALVQLKKEGVQ